MKELFKKYHHVLAASYTFVYFAWFLWLEKTVTPETDYYSIHIWLDDYIPFNEVFVIPYLLWFLYVPVVMGFIAYVSRSEFYKSCFYLFSGMSLCLLICTLWPNGQDLRVKIIDPDKNIFTWLLSMVYNNDTNTNVFPSIHSYNSVVMFFILYKSKHLVGKIRKPILWMSGILTTLIIISTVVLKQHSVVDAIGGVSLGLIMYAILYMVNWKAVFAGKKKNAEDEKINDNISEQTM